MPLLRAPAKVNLTLEVLSRREDGYHTLRSLMVPIDLCDRIGIEPAAAGGFMASDAAVGNDNTVTRAIALLELGSPYNVTLEKQIPIGGGLGGGSSDAAAILRAAMRGDLGSQRERDYIAIARAVGSDVPFFLLETGALVEGTGERVTAVGRLPQWWVLVAQPHATVATADAYRILDALRIDTSGDSRPRATSVSLSAVDAIQRADFSALCEVLSNDFHAPILAAEPAIAAAHEAMVRAGAPGALLSGSGACLFALFEAREDAERVRAAIDPSVVRATFVCALLTGDAWR